MEPGGRALQRRLPPAVPPGPDPAALGRLAGILVAGQRVVIVTARTAADPPPRPCWPASPRSSERR